MGERQSRAAAVTTLLAVLVLVLGLGGSVLADPDKDESGKGQEQSKESEEHADKKGRAEDEKSDDGSGDDNEASGSGSSGGSRESSRSSQSSSTADQQQQSDQQGNIPCTALGSGFLELKLQNPDSGTYSDGTLTVTFQRTGEGTFSWSSNIDVDAVIAKGGSNSNIYRYPGTDDGFSGSATTPTNPSNNRPYGLSHVSFCYDTSGSTTTPPGSPPPTTPGSPPPTTPGPPPDDDESPLEEACPPGTDMAGQPIPAGGIKACDDLVLGDIITNDDDDVLGTDVGDENATRPQSTGALPFTGANVLAIGLLGLLVAGSGLLVLRKNRD